VALVTLADLYRLAGDMDQAEKTIKQAEQLDPNSQTVVHGRFKLLVAQKRLDALGPIIDKYLSAKDQDLSVVSDAAMVLTSLDSKECKNAAVRLFEHAVALAPESVDTRLNLASILDQTGNAEAAEKVYRELLAQYPDNVQVLNDLAWILQEHDHRYAEALEFANKGLARAPGDVHLLDTRGTVLSNMPDRLVDARKDFQRLADLSPVGTARQAKAFLQLGRVCAKLGDLAQAKQHVEKALEVDSKTNAFTAEERSEIAKIIQQSEVQPKQ
jgi:tetratricopeptide (TPR) repeat protein